MKINPGIKKVFEKLYDNLYQEYTIHLLYIDDEQGNREVKLDKKVKGSIWRIGIPGEYSKLGETTWEDPVDGSKVRLLKITQ